MLGSTLTRHLGTFWNGQHSLLFFRNIAAIGIAAVACLVPAIGPNRFWLAGVLVFVCVPVATWIELHVSVEESAWVQPLFDLSVLLGLIHLVPSVWFPGLVIGLMIVQAPSIAEVQSSSAFYALFAAILTIGMTAAAVLHDVPGWELPVLSMLVLYPSVIFYSYRQAKRANEFRERALALDGLHLVAGGVAHDFNNLLTSVMGNAELAQLEIEDGTPASAALDRVIQGTERASLLAARLLAFSGRDMAEEEVLDVESEVTALVGLLETVVPKGVELELIASDQDLRIRARRVRLHQIVMNLVLNASEASQAPGKVRVEVDAVSSPAREAGWVRICVVDYGAGVAPEHPAQSADAFFTLKEQGQGLGLSSAGTIARELGGKLEVDRTLGSGSRTTVLLPQASPRPERLAADRTPIPERGVALVVDDEEPVRAVLAQMLEQLGHRVILSGDGHEAIRALQDHAEDVTVVLLDLRMPGMDGWQCLRELRRIRADIPVLVCSGHDPYDGAGPGRDERLGYLTKPLRLADLRKALSALSAGDIA